MELTLKRLLENAEFKKYRGKGYDPTEVDDFLDRATAMAAKVEVQLTQALEQAKAGGGAAPVDQAAIDAEIERRVGEQVAAKLAEQAAAPRSGPTEDETAQEAQRTLVMAQRTADAAVREARDDADKLLAAAKEQAEALLADAEARSSAVNAESEQRAAASKAAVEAEAASERREARQRLANEIGELEGLRETLRSDVSVLERHVEEQRTQLGSTLAELHQILDDPSGFRLAPAPALADPEIPDFSDLDDPEPQVVASEPVAAEPVAERAPDPSPVEPAPVEPDRHLDVEDAPAPEPQPEPEAPAATSDEPERPPAPQALAFDEVDHEAPGLDDPPDAGPPTAPVSAVDLGFEPEGGRQVPEDGDEDAFLTELRKAMADDQPLGPRDVDELTGGDALFDDDDRRGWRFGKRR